MNIDGGDPKIRRYSSKWKCGLREIPRRLRLSRAKSRELLGMTSRRSGIIGAARPRSRGAMIWDGIALLSGAAATIIRRLPGILRRSLAVRSAHASSVAVLACALALTGCQGGVSQKGEGSRNKIKIGTITSLTGSNAAFGQAHKNGYAIALDELNSRGGLLGKTVELDYYDDQSRPDQAVQGVSKLVDLDNVPIILGAYSSENTRAIVPAVTHNQVPLPMPTATADNVMETGSPWTFRICAGSGAYATATVAFLKGMGAPKTMAIIYENTNFGQSNAQAMQAAAKQAGIEVVDTEAYQASTPDYKALLQRVKARSPAVIYFASYLLYASTLMRQAEQVGLNPS